MKKRKSLPHFTSKQEEAEFWLNHDSADYIDWSKAKSAHFPNLKPSTKVISLRLPETLLYDLKILANKQDIPYQSLMKIFLAQGVQRSG